MDIPILTMVLKALLKQCPCVQLWKSSRLAKHRELETGSSANWELGNLK